MKDVPRRIVITGGAGNLGQKLAAVLDEQALYDEIVIIDRLSAPSGGRCRSVLADLCDPHDPAWIVPVAGADAVLHLAADNPYPDCTWNEACRSLDMTANLLARAAHKAVRFVFASSNHVMGGYKEADLTPGSLTTAREPDPGTRFYTPDGWRRDLGYASAKLLGERLVRSAALSSDGRMTAVCLRIGWCQPGANDPRTITADGLKPDARRDAPHEGYDRDLQWFRQMWLSNRDLASVVLGSLAADSTAWPEAAIVVNAVSANAGTAWDNSAGRTLIDYAPRDDVWDNLSNDIPREQEPT
jgi:nucleoside-diphosphate-sugar epimerase